MNKVQVGHAPSPNLKAVRSKIGSLDNATYKPGGGHVKIESKKLDIKAAPRIEAKNDKYAPKGGEKKVCFLGAPMCSILRDFYLYLFGRDRCIHFWQSCQDIVLLHKSL